MNRKIITVSAFLTFVTGYLVGWATHSPIAGWAIVTGLLSINFSIWCATHK